MLVREVPHPDFQRPYRIGDVARIFFPPFSDSLEFKSGFPPFHDKNRQSRTGKFRYLPFLAVSFAVILEINIYKYITLNLGAIKKNVGL